MFKLHIIQALKLFDLTALLQMSTTLIYVVKSRDALRAFTNKPQNGWVPSLD